MKAFSISTGRKVAFLDITAQVAEAVRGSGVEEGMAVVYVPHTTAGITINENADPDVRADIIEHLDKMVPDRAGYRHSEGNSAAHIKASLMGFSVTVIVNEGRLALGTWQGIYFCEFDGPRTRSFSVQVMQGNP